MAALLPNSANGQISDGEVRGTIVDPSGAVVQGAKITIEGIASGEIRRMVSNASGFYDAPHLPVGLYRLTVEAPGFSPGKRTGVSVQVASENVVDVRLAIPGAGETITVAPQTEIVDLATSHIGAVDGGQIIRELPLNGRDWTTLAA
jgi:hypothetical protein